MHSKDVGWSPVAFHFFFLFNLLFCSSLFLILCRYEYNYLNLPYVYSTNVNNFNKPKCNSSARWMILILLLSSADFFFSKLTFSKHLSGTLSECQTVCIQIRTKVLSVLIWEQTVCKGYQHTKKSPLTRKE